MTGGQVRDHPLVQLAFVQVANLGLPELLMEVDAVAVVGG